VPDGSGKLQAVTSASHITSQVAWSSFTLAFIFGFVGNRVSFCTMGAVSDIVTMDSWGRMRMWLLAMAVAIIGASTLHYLGLVDLSKSYLRRPNLLWFSHLAGGFLFGVGMVLGSGCGSKTLIRIGGGNLKSVVVFVFLGISAYMTLRGLFGPWRKEFFDALSIDLAALGISGQDLPTLFGAALHMDPQRLLPGIAAAVAIALLVFIFKDPDFRATREYTLGGVVVGLVVTAGWYVTGHLGYGENPDTLENVFFATNSKTAESFSFVAPVAYTLELLMLWTDKSLTVSFGIAAVLGVIVGSLVYALVSRTFRWEGFASPTDTRNHILGGVLMGFGGVTALGCTIGQGITGISTLATGSFIALGAMILGAAVTIKYQYWRLMQEM
jgi:uncharacterized membrane protein YedE/YeeE